MSDPITLLRRDTEPRHTPGRSAPLPRDLLEQVRRRVRVLALLLIFAFSLDPILVLVVFVGARLSGDPLPESFYASLGFTWIDLVGVALSVGLWWLARRRDVSSTRLHTAGLVYMVCICLIISLVHMWESYAETGVLPSMTWVPTILVLFPLVLPGRPRRMLVAALTAAAMSPIALAMLEATGRVVAISDDYINATIKPLLAVLFAYMSARLVYGLGREVAAARELGSYRLERRLGQGGMGEVWQARHRMLARPAAIKLIRPALTTNGANGFEEADARFEREARSIASLRSPHTVDVFDFGVTEDGAFYYAMELLDGLDADRLVQRTGPLPPERVVYLLGQICHSLSEAHARGLVHRDIKPANIFICRYGEDVDFVKVLDFGLVKALDDGALPATSLTTEHVVQGTPAFMAPEQALGRSDIDGRADIYAVGCVVYWLLTGALVFEGDTPMALLSHHARTAPLGPSARTTQEIPEPLERLVLECLAKDPEERPQSARELAARASEVQLAGDWTPRRAREWWDAFTASDGAAVHAL